MKKLLVISLIALSGCASIVDGGTQTVNLVASSGDKVHAKITTPSGYQESTLPTVISTKKKNQDIIVNVDDSCYEPTTQAVQPSLAPAFWGNVIIGGLIGSTTDFATGAAWKYDNTNVVYVAKKASCNK